MPLTFLVVMADVALVSTTVEPWMAIEVERPMLDLARSIDDLVGFK